MMIIGIVAGMLYSYYLTTVDPEFDQLVERNQKSRMMDEERANK